jgi:hypothetical protein
MIDGATLPSVKAIKAHVRNGQIVPDEPVELPEGAAVEVLVEVDDDFAMTPEALEEHERELDLRKAEIARGEYVDGLELARKLAARSATEPTTPEELEQLSREIDLGYAEYERGEVVNARDLIRSLKSRR